MKKNPICLIIFILCFVFISCDIFVGENSERDYSGRDVETDTFKMDYLGFTDYYSSDCIALKYDFTNKTSKIIDHMR